MPIRSFNAIIAIQKSQLRQHISFLKDFFRSYKPDFESKHIDTLEIMLSQLYAEYKITDNTDFSMLKPTDYPTLNNLFSLIEHERKIIRRIWARSTQPTPCKNYR